MSALRNLLLLLCLLIAVPVSAQPAPIVGTTVRTTDTSASSLCVGGSNGCASATGGIKAGVVDTGLITSGGAIGIASNVPGVTTMKLYNNAGTLSWNGSPLSIGGSTVSGTIGKLAKFTGAAAVGDSICSESGTTITCVNTVSATTLTGTLSTVSQPNVTTMAGLTTAGALVTVGTIGSGTWQGTIIDLARGGAGVSLSATGGTSQFLRQNGAGSTITVVRPAISDLSDSSNVALLNAANTFTASPQTVSSTNTYIKTLSAGTTNDSAFRVSDGTTEWYAGLLGSTVGTGGSYRLFTGGSTLFQISTVGVLTIPAVNASHEIGGTSTSAVLLHVKNTSGSLYLGTDTSAGASFSTGNYAAVVLSDVAAGLSVGATNGSGVLRLYAGGSSQRFGVNAAGDWIVGTSSHIADSVGTPAITAGGGTGPAIVGNDYAFKVTTGSTGSTTFTVTFGHTFSNVPIVVFTSTATNATINTLSTSAISFTYDSTISTPFWVIVRGY